MKKLKGFTLAEVLITLAIIGVVAALTIPVVVAKYQKQQYYTNFMKTFNTLSDAMSMAVAENGEYNTWTSFDAIDFESRQSIFNNIAPYLKISKNCKNDSTYCGVNGSNISQLNGTTTTGYNLIIMFSGRTVMLDDGNLIIFTNLPSGAGISFMFDINGAKAPNTYGRDIFTLQYTKVNNKWLLTAPLMATYQDQTTLLNKLDGSSEPNCNTNYTSSGAQCSARLLLKDKMDY